MLPFWRLEPPFRFAIYSAFAVLFASGAAWLVAGQMKESANGEIWQQAAAYLLMVHGGAAMLTLMLLGALFPLHIGRAWRAKKNRTTGIVMLTFNAVLIATAFGLYYLASEILRPWASDLHIAFGLAIPLLFLAHVKTGRNRA
jgi:cation transport ATPase